MPSCGQVNEQELFDFANSELKEDRQTEVRLTAWRKGNDKRRNSEKSIPMSQLEKVNLHIMVEMMEYQKQVSNLIYAEILRELGKFEDSRRVIEALSYDEYKNDTVNCMSKLIRSGDSQVREVTQNYGYLY